MAVLYTLGRDYEPGVPSCEHGRVWDSYESTG
jgi:hypothetical protein